MALEAGREWSPPGVDASAPSVARVHDALLGGTENFAVDRAVATKLKTAVPEVVDLVWCNRSFIGRVTDFLVREAGVTQIIDVGAGLPTIENTHEVAQFADPAVRVVYVDNDPMVEPHALSILRENGRATAITADARDVDAVLGHPELLRHIDFSRPVAIMMVGLLHLFPDSEDPWRLVTDYMGAVPRGSYLAATNFHTAQHPQAKALEAMLHATMGTGFFRSRAAVERYFEGFELVEPGVVNLAEWRPDEHRHGGLATWEEVLLGGVARKP
ncbi:SAM-dependent methyltransferase [Nonomuraea sp. NPDC050663]|uniref:SAM-dependent methyltransferase n=1 Tax=Nonomuraea sp. NPDC050663 TaxID=3364370 RepID=UPI0037AABC9D